MFLQAALNGTRAPGEHDALPLSPEELARDARAAVDAGAKALHVHPRGEDGRESLAPAAVDAAVAALREALPDVELSLTTGLWITDGDVEARLEAVRGWSELPDCCSLNVAEEGWRELGELLAERGVWIEAGLWAPSHPERLAESGLARHCRRALDRAAGDRAGDGGHHRRRDRRQPRAPRDHAPAAAPRHRPDHVGGARRRRPPRARDPDRLRGHVRAARRAARELERRARRRGGRALRRQDIRLTASSAATL